jgi:CheY-like chemotaxis protein
MPYDLSRLQLLIVEDSQFMQRLLRELLKSIGVPALNIEIVANGEAALSALRDKAPDILICDWQMSGMSGLDLIKKLRDPKAGPNAYVPIILCTAFTHRKKMEAARDAGVHEILAKPLKAEDMYARIASIIESPRPFIRAPGYFGPDRRRRDLPFEGPDKRQDTVEL